MVNIIILVMLFFSTIIVSNVISNYQVTVLINSSLRSKNIVSENNYYDFMAHYYDSQSDWLNKWLTILGLLLAFSGIAIPLMLNASYKEKFQELQREAEKYKLAAVKQEEKIQVLIRDFNKNYNKKIEEFEERMKNAIQKAEMDSILLKIETLKEDAARYRNKGNLNDEIAIYKQIIQLARHAENKYPNDTSFNYRIWSTLEDSHYIIGLNSMLDERYKDAILNFEKCRLYNQKCKQTDTPALMQSLLECYILEKKFSKASEILDSIHNINREELDGTKLVSSHNYLELLQNEENEEAKNLLLKLEEKIMD